MVRRQLVFGYGSLAVDLGGEAAELRGHRRLWGVAMDNGRDVPGYKHYVLRADGGRPQVHVAFLDIVQDAQSAVNGVIGPVDEAALRELDRRERNYVRVDVTGDVPGATRTVWAYVGSPGGRARLRAAHDRGQAVISRDYLERVRAGFAALGPQQLAAFERSTDPGGLEAWDLVRIAHAL